MCQPVPKIGRDATYGEWLKTHMDVMQVTHDWMAWRIDSSESAVQQWACGKTVPTIRYFLRICRLITLATHRPFPDILIEAADCVDNQTCR